MDIGLFYGCKKMDNSEYLDNCRPLDWDQGEFLVNGDEDFFKAARCLLGLNALFMIVSFISSIVSLCKRKSQTCIMLPATFSLVGALCGGAGIVTLFMWKYDDFNPLRGFPAALTAAGGAAAGASDPVAASQEAGEGAGAAAVAPAVSPDDYVALEKGWAFFMSIAGCGFVLIASIFAMCAPARQGKYILETGGAVEVQPAGEVKTVYNPLDDAKTGF